MKIKKFKNYKINESSKIEICSDETGKCINVSKDDITLLLDKGYIWQDEQDYSFREQDYWAIQQMINGIGTPNEGKTNKFLKTYKLFENFNDKTWFSENFYNTNVWYEIHTNKSFNKWKIAIDKFINNFGKDAKIYLDDIFEGEDYFNINSFPTSWLEKIENSNIIYLVSPRSIDSWIYDYGPSNSDSTGQPGEWWTDDDLKCGGIIYISDEEVETTKYNL